MGALSTRGLGALRATVVAAVVLLTVGVSTFVPAMAEAATPSFRPTFPSAVPTDTQISVSVRVRTSRAVRVSLQKTSGRGWVTTTAVTVGHSGSVTLKAPSVNTPGAVMLRAQATRHGRRIWRSSATKVTITSTCPAGQVGTPPDCHANPNRGASLRAGDLLSSGQYLESADGRYFLIMQGDGNLVLYERGNQGNVAKWSSETSDGAFAQMQGDGNFVIYDASKVAKWSSNTADYPDSVLTLQNDGNLVVYQRGRALWTRTDGYIADHGGQGTVLRSGDYIYSANHSYFLVMQGDGNLVMYHRTGQTNTAVWSAGPQGAGAFAQIQGDGNFVVYNANSVAKWSTNTADYPNATLWVQNDGNLVVYGHNRPLWTRDGGYIGDTGFAGTVLWAGDYIYSPDHTYFLVMQGDGNLVLYHRTGQGNVAVWSAGPQGAGAFAQIQGDGNFVVYNASSVAKWSSATAGHPGAFLRVQNDGNLVVYENGSALWTRSSPGGPGGATSQAQAIVNAAQAAQNAGYPYCFAGGTINGPSIGTTDPASDGYYSNCSQIGKVGFDCTGLTLYAVYKGTGNAGLSHGANQAQTGGGQFISNQADLRPGDVVYFSRGSNGINNIAHAGIYVGGGNVLSAVSEHYGIQTHTISWYASGGLNYVGAKRYW